ncbi:uncharacterized protein LOC124142414 [Haliotis rufescens]|uniref:uncharacterized protein LOC124142414 n=1 Tax=Haliotis rufescens TaxID=6454 RepID=UPI00201EA302|nr:uncharacterized protein LOC124142414 [Haliotis rufescens]
MEDRMNTYEVDEAESDQEESFRLNVLNKVKSGLGVVVREGEVRITVDNVLPVLNILGIKHTDDRVLDMTTQALAQSQGEIRQHDFYKCVTQIFQLSEEYHEEIIRKAFSVVDVAGDGFITGADIYRLMLSLGEVISDDEIMYMLKAVDSDGDDRISFEDFRGFLTRGDDTVNTSLDKDITDSNIIPEKCNNIPFHAKRKSLLSYRKLQAAIAFLIKHEDATKPSKDTPVKRQDTGTRQCSTNFKFQYPSPPVTSGQSPERKRLSIAELLWVSPETQSLVIPKAPRCNTQPNPIALMKKEEKGRTQLPSHYNTHAFYGRKSSIYSTMKDDSPPKVTYDTLTRVRKPSRDLEQEPLFVRGRCSSIVNDTLTRVRKPSRDLEQEPLFVRGRCSSIVNATSHLKVDLSNVERSNTDNQEPKRYTSTRKQEHRMNQDADATAEAHFSSSRLMGTKCLNMYVSQNENDIKSHDLKRCVDMMPESYNDQMQLTANNHRMVPFGRSKHQQLFLYGKSTNMADVTTPSLNVSHRRKTRTTEFKNCNLINYTVSQGLFPCSYDSLSRRLERQPPLTPQHREREQRVKKASFQVLELPAEKTYKPRYKNPSLLSQLPVCSHRKRNLPVFLG